MRNRRETPQSKEQTPEQKFKECIHEINNIRMDILNNRKLTINTKINKLFSLWIIIKAILSSKIQDINYLLEQVYIIKDRKMRTLETFSNIIELLKNNPNNKDKFIKELQDVESDLFKKIEELTNKPKN
ncbi:hypothetical protein HRbin34_00234 [bacterium HR34]|nr:hypothetical protein HRbin34_00234 [bacterium HR34]